MSNYRRGQFSGVLAGCVEDLRAEFSRLGYAPSVVNSHLALWAQVSRWLEGQGLAASDLTSDRIGEFLGCALRLIAVSTRSRRCLPVWNCFAAWEWSLTSKRWRRRRPRLRRSKVGSGTTCC
jgi:hypothetical protein